MEDLKMAAIAIITIGWAAVLPTIGLLWLAGWLP